jgi:hypothetical protein
LQLNYESEDRMTVLAPPILMKVYVTSVTATTSWPSDGSTYAGYPYEWRISFTVTPQSTSYPASTTPYYYNGANITAGMWVSNEVGGAAWQIISISSSTTSAVTCIVSDVAQYNTYNDPTGTGSGGPSSLISGFVFSLNSANVPILSAVTSNVLTSQWQTDMLARFAYVNPASSSGSGSGSGLSTSALPAVAVGSLYGTTGGNAAEAITIGSGLALTGGVLSASSATTSLSIVNALIFG